jgi:hypothetical protein
LGILVNVISKDEFKVIVDCKISTKHLVKLSDIVHLRLPKNLISKMQLLELSFKFLLDRVSNTSILKSFELDIISDYFSDYAQYIKNIVTSNKYLQH